MHSMKNARFASERDAVINRCHFLNRAKQKK
jgi:hypothetical protein